MSSEDDWETADLSAVAQSKSKAKPLLRAGASPFQPRPGTTVSPGPGSHSHSSQSEAGPSRVVSSFTGYIARPPIVSPAGVGLGRTGSPSLASTSTAGGAGGGAGDEWFRGPKAVSNRQIWDAANNHAPSHLLGPTASAPGGTNGGSSPSPYNQHVSPLPQPGITILRRQPGPDNKKKGGGTQTPPKTMEEREEEYRLVRERIFGAEGGGGGAESATGSGGMSRSGVLVQAGQPGTERVRSGGGRSRTPGPQVSRDLEYNSTGAGVGGRIPSPASASASAYGASGRLYNESFPSGQGAGMMETQGLGPIPVQVRRSPAPSGVLRQPNGPSQGGGFGR